MAKGGQGFGPVASRNTGLTIRSIVRRKLRFTASLLPVDFRFLSSPTQLYEFLDIIEIHSETETALNRKLHFLYKHVEFSFTLTV